MKSPTLAIAFTLCAGAALGGEPKHSTVYVLLVKGVLDRQTFPAPHPAGRVDAEIEIGADACGVPMRASWR
ncbi:hypothetical protein [Methylosinus sp. RM1]|uniref:hypothetical protein n=1 Tax=Methylosinus sp. RM1 TaxID=2583817 RepID=UPI00140A30A3|nr:hypothetical protein [Methylosinus sp. RM1]